MDAMKKTVGIVGARGHTGAELIRLVAAHPALELAFVSSRELDGQRVADHDDAYSGDLRYGNLDPHAVAGKRADVVILALPNGKAAPYVEAIDKARPDTLIVDLSADHRFDGAWYYGLPELTRGKGSGQRRISNPGCYATAIELSVAPIKDVLAAPPVCFGVSGYSGAGTTPSDKNNPEKLRDNLMPYALTGHVHEKEAAFRLGIPVEFMPHVAPHFRGLTVTTNLYLSRAMEREDVLARFRDAYAAEPLVRVVDEPPWVSRIAGLHHAEIGGFAMSADGRRVVIVATLDNLLKGAATQAMQNINIALGLDELTGISICRRPGDAGSGHG
ncbi:MAG: N-acetyl-gamma-glutamyl-phosphate reductase [Xanthomonadales bacterium]|nr:N-acetyl-gamma-glutamyl-phosphate reductase [Xanthomonadales bacterium]ODU94868.1 MAG: N-acetyl-gamma-glutamyl-phosphate reductase [Rhodanobacter sp. SCN 66-43]OJY82854.1 MAG: N-acetyl-gamma-glutamyl-phosphate reductase [Xanthomonadales bacterium 66-474]